MNELNTILAPLHSLLDRTIYRQPQVVSNALLVMTSRITMLGISRWAGKGGSYRTIQRFFSSKIPWATLNWAIARPIIEKSKGVVLISGDVTTVTKSGKETHGLGKFFSSIYSRAVPGIAFQHLSLISGIRNKTWVIFTTGGACFCKHTNRACCFY